MSDKKEDIKYSLSLTGKDINLKCNVSEQVAKKLLIAVGGGTISNVAGAGVPSEGAIGEPKESLITQPPKAFVASKRPATDIERITCLGYYLVHCRRIIAFKTIELTKLNTEASQPRLSNPTAAARNAVQSDFFALAGGGKKQITVRGEALVEALPSRVKVKEALDTNPLRRRHRKSKRLSKKTK